MRAREFINLSEIVLSPGRDEYITNKNYLFNNVEKTQTPVFDNNKSYDYAMTKEYDVEYYALLDDDNVVALLRLENSRLDRDKYQVLSTQVEQSLRGLGLMRYLFNRALDSHGAIYSDTHQSQDAKHFWTMLITYPEARYSVYIYDSETHTMTDTQDYIGNIEKTISKHIWNNKENPILVCIKNKFTAKQSMISERNNSIRKRVNRDDWTLWYSRSTIKGYENP